MRIAPDATSKRTTSIVVCLSLHFFSHFAVGDRLLDTMTVFECFRTTVNNPLAIDAQLACEQDLEIALLINYLLSGMSLMLRSHPPFIVAHEVCVLGAAIAVTFLCIYHIIKRFRAHLPAQYVLLTFTILLVVANVVSLVLLTQSYHTYIHFMLAAASSSTSTDGIAVFLGPSIPELVQEVNQRAFAQELYLPIFFWLTDALLVSPTFIISSRADVETEAVE